jgi:hypothetical protein
MAYYVEEGFSSNQVAGAIAAAALHDLNVNAFAFDGFPGVQIRRSPFGFSVWLVHGKHKTKSMEIPISSGAELARSFQRKEQIEDEWFKKVQDLLVELERLTSQK